MPKWVLLYCIHINIPMVPFLYIIWIILFLQITLDNIVFMKIKIKKPKHKKINSKLNGLHFVESIQNIPLVVDGKVSQGGHYCVLSPFNCIQYSR
jgi:dolichol kinase